MSELQAILSARRRRITDISDSDSITSAPSYKDVVIVTPADKQAARIQHEKDEQLKECGGDLELIYKLQHGQPPAAVMCNDNDNALNDNVDSDESQSQSQPNTIRSIVISTNNSFDLKSEMDRCNDDDDNKANNKMDNISVASSSSNGSSSKTERRMAAKGRMAKALARAKTKRAEVERYNNRIADIEKDDDDDDDDDDDEDEEVASITLEGENKSRTPTTGNVKEEEEEEGGKDWWSPSPSSSSLHQLNSSLLSLDLEDLDAISESEDSIFTAGCGSDDDNVDDAERGVASASFNVDNNNGGDDNIMGHDQFLRRSTQNSEFSLMDALSFGGGDNTALSRGSVYNNNNTNDLEAGCGDARARIGNSSSTNDHNGHQQQQQQRYEFASDHDASSERILGIADNAVNEQEEIDEIDSMLEKEEEHNDMNARDEEDERQRFTCTRQQRWYNNPFVVCLMIVLFVLFIVLGVSLGRAASTSTINESNKEEDPTSLTTTTMEPIVIVSSLSPTYTVNPSSSPTLTTSTSYDNTSSLPSHNPSYYTSKPATSTPTMSPVTLTPRTFEPSSSSMKSEPTISPVINSIPSFEPTTTTSRPSEGGDTPTTLSSSNPTTSPTYAPTVPCESRIRKKECLRPRKEMCQWDMEEQRCMDPTPISSSTTTTPTTATNDNVDVDTDNDDASNSSSGNDNRRRQVDDDNVADGIVYPWKE